jgi:phosphoglycolate phosphatase
MTIDAVIFDLDGTLVDSANGILTSFAGAFQICGRKTEREINDEVIGPPLSTTLRILSGSEDEEVIEPLKAAFMDYYDKTGYKETKVYDGVTEMLRRLKQSTLPIFIATNKRKIPTDKIVSKLNWGAYFEAVYALDSLQPPASTKGVLIKHILLTHQLQPSRTIYVGDREDDSVAATEAGVQFYRATWGNGGLYDFEPLDKAIKKLIEVLKI